MNLLRGILPCCNEKRMLQKVKLFQYINGMITSYLRKRKLFVQLLFYVNSSLPNNDIISSWCALWLLCQSSSWPTHSSSLRERLCIAFTNRPMLSRIYFEVQLETTISAMYFAYFFLFILLSWWFLRHLFCSQLLLSSFPSSRAANKSSCCSTFLSCAAMCRG